MSKVKKFLDSRRQNEVKKGKKVSMPKKEFVKEHKRLVSILKEDCGPRGKKEAKDQAAELKEETQKADYSTADIGCGSGLAGKICSHNKKKLNHFVSAYKVKKSMDFQETKTSVDSVDQQLAENNTNSNLINYLKSEAKDDISKIKLAKGILTLSKKEPGLYNGFFSDTEGQVVEKFDSQTLELIAKNLELKELVEVPPLMQAQPQPVEPKAPGPEDIAYAAHDRIDMAHNRMDAMQRVIDEQKGKAKTLKIRFGDFELELRKSVKEFATDFRKSQNVEKDIVQKAIASWRKKASNYTNLPNDLAAAKELLSNWDQYQEEFSQAVYALQQAENEDGEG